MQTQTTLTPLGEGDRFALVLDRSTLDALTVAPNATFDRDRAVPGSRYRARRASPLPLVAP